jgi:hypothetical protein
VTPDTTRKGWGTGGNSTPPLLETVAFSDPGEELESQPVVFYRWQKEFFENGATVFRSRRNVLPAKRSRNRQAEQKRKRLEFGEKKADQGRGPG